jgi:hypothetical protein
MSYLFLALILIPILILILIFFRTPQKTDTETPRKTPGVSEPDGFAQIGHREEARGLPLQVPQSADRDRTGASGAAAQLDQQEWGFVIEGPFV